MSLPKIIICGNCAIDITLPSDATALPLRAEVNAAGTLLNTAIRLGKAGHRVAMVGEVARDAVGDILLRHLSDNNIETASIDRYTDCGTTPLQVSTSAHGNKACINYGRYPDEKFDTVWPRIDPGDIVVFGSAFALDARVRPQLLELLDNAAQRNATIIYVPDIASSITHGITRVMPAILENLETAHIVATQTSDLSAIFGSDDPEQCYREKINFYCPTSLNSDLNEGELKLMYPSGCCSERTAQCDSGDASMPSAILAAFIGTIAELGLTRQEITAPTPVMAHELAAGTAKATSHQ